MDLSARSGAEMAISENIMPWLLLLLHITACQVCPMNVLLFVPLFHCCRTPGTLQTAMSNSNM
jgi:hypothetical protein